MRRISLEMPHQRLEVHRQICPPNLWGRPPVKQAVATEVIGHSMGNWAKPSVVHLPHRDTCHVVWLNPYQILRWGKLWRVELFRARTMPLIDNLQSLGHGLDCRFGLQLELGGRTRRRGSRRRSWGVSSPRLDRWWALDHLVALFIHIHGLRVPPCIRLVGLHRRDLVDHGHVIIVIVINCLDLALLDVVELFLFGNLQRSHCFEIINVKILFFFMNWITGHDSRRAFVIFNEVPALELLLLIFGRVGSILPLLVMLLGEALSPCLNPVFHGECLDFDSFIVGISVVLMHRFQRLVLFRNVSHPWLNLPVGSGSGVLLSLEHPVENLNVCIKHHLLWIWSRR